MMQESMNKLKDQDLENKMPYPDESPVRPVVDTKGAFAMENKGTGWKRWLNYQAVVKQVPFFLFLATLAVMYIYNGHNADKTIRNINRTSREVKELQYEYIDVKSRVMGQSKQSEVVKAVEPLGLKELVGSPVVLKDTITAD